MHLHNEEARRGGDLGRAPECVCVAADVLEFNPDLLARQAVWIARRLGLTIERARLIAGIAFHTEARRG